MVGCRTRRWRAALLVLILLIASGCSLANNSAGPSGRPPSPTSVPPMTAEASVGRARPQAPTSAEAPAATAQSYAVLFDASHAETAGNADWVISTSQPDPLRENPRPRDEADWTGAISAWGVALQRTSRYRLMTLPRGQQITFGDQRNTLDLSQFDVFVVPEPNVRFTDDEKRAIMSFVQQGGGLFMIADHDGSDRNNDGMDSLAIWNDLMRNNPVADGDPFGFSFDVAAISRDNPPSIQAGDDPIIAGPFGQVAGSILRDGTTATLHPENNPAARGLLYLSQSERGGAGDVFFLISSFGRGRVAAWGDSSPIDDGSGAPGERLFDGWNDPAGSNAALALNATAWLAGGEQTEALATPAPRAQPTGAALPGREIVENGGFEAGVDSWRVSAGAGRSLLDTRQSHSGSNAVVFCGFDYCDESLSQTLKLPRGTVRLTFFTRITTQEQGRAFDFLTAELRDPNGQTLAQLLRLSNTDAEGGWRERSVDLSDYAGRTVELVFGASTGKLKPTEFAVDDVRVTVE